MNNCYASGCEKGAHRCGIPNKPTQNKPTCCENCLDVLSKRNGLRNEDRKVCADVYCPCHTQTTPSEEELYENIERCIGICSNPAYKGSYAAPREAFRAILREIRTAAYEKGREDEAKNCTGCTKQAAEAITEAENHGYEKGVRDSLEVVESLRETPEEVRVMSHTAEYHFGLNRVASKLHTLLK